MHLPTLYLLYVISLYKSFRKGTQQDNIIECCGTGTMVKDRIVGYLLSVTKWWSLEMSGNGGNLKGINRNSSFPPRPTSCVVTKAENIIV